MQQIGSTVIIIAFSGSINDVRQALKNGANVNFTNYRNETALHMASSQGRMIIIIDIKWIFDWNQESNFPYFSGAVDIVELLIQHKAAVNAHNINKETPLHIAARLGYEKIVGILIENGAEIEDRNGGNKTPLFLAVLKRELNAVYMLIRHGADINTADSESNTALHVAAKYGTVYCTI